MRPEVLCYPKACRAFFDGGSTKTLGPLAAHIAANKCRNLQQIRRNKARKLNGPYHSTTMREIHAAMEDIAARAATQPNSGVTHTHADNF